MLGGELRCYPGWTGSKRQALGWLSAGLQGGPGLPFTQEGLLGGTVRETGEQAATRGQRLLLLLQRFRNFKQ